MKMEGGGQLGKPEVQPQTYLGCFQPVSILIIQHWALPALPCGKKDFRKRQVLIMDVRLVQYERRNEICLDLTALKEDVKHLFVCFGYY